MTLPFNDIATAVVAALETALGKDVYSDPAAIPSGVTSPITMVEDVGLEDAGTKTRRAWIATVTIAVQDEGTTSKRLNDELEAIDTALAGVVLTLAGRTFWAAEFVSGDSPQPVDETGKVKVGRVRYRMHVE